MYIYIMRKDVTPLFFKIITDLIDTVEYKLFKYNNQILIKQCND